MVAPRSHLSILFIFIVGLTSLVASTAPAQIDVWVDPGHGGWDSGAEGFNGGGVPNEKELNIGVASRIENRLTALGYYAYRTQNYDTTYFQPWQRRQIANGERSNDQSIRSLCRLLISVHMNSVESSSPYGTLTLYAAAKYEGKDETAYAEDSTAAAKIQVDLMHNADLAFLFCSKDRGIHPDMTLAILKKARMPAVLVEVCFISNGCQWGNIITAGDQELCAEGIAAGVSHYLPILFESPAPPEPVQPVTVATPPKVRAPVTLLEQGFDGTTFPPTGWIQQTAGLPAPHRWHQTTNLRYIGNGNGSARVGSKSPSAIDEWLITPAVALSAPDHAIKFSWSGSKVWSGALNASLSVRAVGTSTWTQLWSIAGSEPAAEPFVFRERAVDVSAWLGMNVEFGFRITGTNGAAFTLDDVVVGNFDPTGPPMNDVCATATSLTGAFDIQDVTCYGANDIDPYTGPQNSCVGSELDGPDMFYEINAAWGDSLHASLAAGWSAGLYLVDDCLNPICLVGGYREDDRTSPVVDHRFAPRGTYYLVVDGEEGSCGPFRLTGEVIPSPTGVARDGATPSLTLDVRRNPAEGPITFFGSFTPNHGARIVVEVYDVTGRRVRGFGCPANAGEYSFTWDQRDQDGQRVASGLYFARLRVGHESVVQKFVILR